MRKLAFSTLMCVLVPTSASLVVPGAAQEVPPPPPPPDVQAALVGVEPSALATTTEGTLGVYLVGKYVESEDATNTFFTTARATSPQRLLGLDAELSGRSVGTGNLVVAQGSAAFAPAPLTPELVRYDLTDDGDLVQSATLDLSSTGLTSLTGWEIAFVSDTKAYIFDTANFRALAWNPATMELSGPIIDFSVAKREGYTLGTGPRDARLVGDRLFVPAYWYDAEGGDLRTSAVLVLDTSTDELTRVAFDDRCPGYMLVPQPSGDLYMFPDGYFAQEFYLDQAAPRTALCALRIRAGEDSFDPDYVQDLGAIVGGNEVSGGGVQGGISDGRGGIYLSVADEALYQAGSPSAYRMWHWDPATGAARELPDAPLWGKFMLSFDQGGHRFGLVQAPEQTTVIDLSTEPFATFVLPGTVETFVRLR